MLYRWNENILELNDGKTITKIAFHEKLQGKPVLSNNGRYIAVGEEKRICIFDSENESFTTILYKSKYRRDSLRFGENDALYYADGNNIGVIDIKNSQDTVLYNVGRTPHNPTAIGISPDGRYVSYLRANEDMYLFDTQENRLKDFKLSVSHYDWLDNGHIVWSKNGGLKILDVDTGKSQSIVKDHRTLTKIIGKEKAKIFDVFKDADSSSLYINVDLLGILGGNIYFKLAISCYGKDEKFEAFFKRSLEEKGHFSSNDIPENSDISQINAKEHYGIWTVSPDGKNAEYRFDFPSGFMRQNGTYKLLMNDGSIAWLENGWHIYDGSSETLLQDDWRKAVYFNSRNA